MEGWDKEAIAWYNRKLRVMKHLAGLCFVCSKPVKKGYKKCEAHVLRDRMSRRKRYVVNKAAGICVACNRPAVEGRVQCEVHLAYARQKIKMRRARGDK